MLRPVILRWLWTDHQSPKEKSIIESICRSNWKVVVTFNNNKKTADDRWPEPTRFDWCEGKIPNLVSRWSPCRICLTLGPCMKNAARIPAAKIVDQRYHYGNEISRHLSFWNRRGWNRGITFLNHLLPLYRMISSTRCIVLRIWTLFPRTHWTQSSETTISPNSRIPGNGTTPAVRTALKATHVVLRIRITVAWIILSISRNFLTVIQNLHQIIGRELQLALGYSNQPSLKTLFPKFAIRHLNLCVQRNKRSMEWRRIGNPLFPNYPLFHKLSWVETV